MDEHMNELIEDEDVEVGGVEAEGPDEAEEQPASPPAERRPSDDGDRVETSLQELLEKREGGAAEEEDDDPIVGSTREERLEPLAVKVIPPTDKEFVCSSCHLVKHRSQIADRSRMLCRDCV
jgi:Domain of unknown function (DUF4193)